MSSIKPPERVPRNCEKQRAEEITAPPGRDQWVGQASWRDGDPGP
jgi:hypothetical protein